MKQRVGNTKNRRVWRVSMKLWLYISDLYINGSPSGSPKCLRFGHWLTLCTLNIHLLTYLLTCWVQTDWSKLSLSDAAAKRFILKKVKGKGRVLAIALLTHELVTRSAFTISEVAADWHELMIPRRIMRPSIARASEQLLCSTVLSQWLWNCTVYHTIWYMVWPYGFPCWM